MKLRAYQQRLLSDARDSLTAGKSPMVQLETGGGKTALAANLVAEWKWRDRLSLVVWTAHRAELLDQAQEALERCGLSVSRWKPGDQWRDHLDTVVLMSAATRSLPAQPPHAARRPLLVIDEAHHSVAKSYRRIVDAGFPRRVGLTATPWRMSRTDALDTLFDTLHEGPSYSTLQAGGWLAPYDLVLAPYGAKIATDSRLNADASGDWSPTSAETVVTRLIATGGAVEAWQQAMEQRPGFDRRTLWYCPTVESAERLRDALRSRGETADTLTGDTPKQERRQRLEQFRAGSLTHLTNVSVATEGFDVPDCAVVVHLRPTRSLALHRQINGRALRPAPGKTALLLDLVGNNVIHGPPDTPVRWTLAPRGETLEPGEAPLADCPVCDCPVHISNKTCGNCDSVLWFVCGRRGDETACGRDLPWRAFPGAYQTERRTRCRTCSDAASARVLWLAGLD